MATMYRIDGEGGHEDPKPCCSGDREIEIDTIFDVLPAQSHEQIAERMSKKLKYTIPSWRVADLLLHLRNNSHRHGWTVPHGSRGKGKGERDKFYAVMFDNNDDPYFDPEASLSVKEGALSTLRMIASEGSHQNRALTIAADYESDPFLSRQVRRIARRHTYLVEEASELLQDWVHPNGNSANGA